MRGVLFGMYADVYFCAKGVIQSVLGRSSGLYVASVTLTSQAGKSSFLFKLSILVSFEQFRGCSH